MKTLAVLVLFTVVCFFNINCGPGPETPTDDGGNVITADGGPIVDGGVLPEDGGQTTDGGPNLNDGGIQDGGTDGGPIADGGPADAGTDPCDMYEPTAPWATGWRCGVDEILCTFTLAIDSQTGQCYFLCTDPQSGEEVRICYVVSGWTTTTHSLVCALDSQLQRTYTCLKQ